LMGGRYRYDCIILHEYLVPPGSLLPLDNYDEDITAGPLAEGYSITEIQEDARYYAGQAVPVYVTEYGQPVSPRPAADLSWNLSLGEGLLTAEQLIEFAYHNVPLAEKYLAVSEPFGSLAGTGYPTRALSILRLLLVLDGLTIKSGLSPDNALIAHVGPFFVAEPDGLVVGLLSRLAGAELLPARAFGASLMGDGQAPELWALAGGKRGVLYLVVVNANPVEEVDIEAKFPSTATNHHLFAYTIDGPSLTSYNSVSQPRTVSVSVKAERTTGAFFTWHLPAHSVTLFQLGASYFPVKI
jgi:hypothetical protein